MDENDWEKLKKLLNDNKQEIANSFTTEMTKLQSNLNLTGKRLRRLESGYEHNAKIARAAIVEGARRDHDRLLRGMFDDSALLVAPLWLEGVGGQRTKASTSCTIDDVTDLLSSCVGGAVKFEVELADKVGYRVLIASHSPQYRRKGAATIIQKARESLEQNLQLRILYDKPYELRMMQKEAHKFLGAVKKAGGDSVKEKKIEKGYFTINGVRIAPEFLVPGPSRWDYLVKVVVEKIRGWRGRPPSSPECGVLYDTFAVEFAAEKGVIDLQDIEFIPEMGDGEDMQE
jgi:hypothetical protein